jgi:hypothetical protein
MTRPALFSLSSKPLPVVLLRLGILACLAAGPQLCSRLARVGSPVVAAPRDFHSFSRTGFQ